MFFSQILVDILLDLLFLLDGCLQPALCFGSIVFLTLFGFLKLSYQCLALVLMLLLHFAELLLERRP